MSSELHLSDFEPRDDVISVMLLEDHSGEGRQLIDGGGYIWRQEKLLGADAERRHCPGLR